MTSPVRPKDRDRSDAIAALMRADMSLLDAAAVVEYLEGEGYPLGVVTLVAVCSRSQIAQYYLEDGPMRIGGFVRGGCERQIIRLLDDLAEAGRLP